MYRLLFEYLIRTILSEEEFTNLNVRSFADRDTRTNTFVDALKNNTPLTLARGEDKVVVDKVQIIWKDPKQEQTYIVDSNEDMSKLKQDLPKLKSGDKLFLFVGSKKYSITAIAKTAELGGKGKGGTLKPERNAIANLQKQFDEIGKPVTVILNGKEYTGITGVTNVKENQKADFALVAGDTPVIFISYKPGNSAKDVISYGGVTGANADVPEVADFIAAVKSKVTDFKGLGYEFGVPLKDESVALKAIYGSNFGGDYGINNVQALMQGDIKLTPKGGAYDLTSSHTLISPTIPDGSYEPYLNARFAGDRNQFGIQHCRIGVVPKGARTNIKSPY